MAVRRPGAFHVQKRSALCGNLRLVPSVRLCQRPCGALGLLDVARDLSDELLLALEGPLVPQALPELDDQPPPVEVALEVEQERLDPPLVAAVVRVDADRDRGAVPERGARRRCRSAGTSRSARRRGSPSDTRACRRARRRRRRCPRPRPAGRAAARRRTTSPSRSELRGSRSRRRRRPAAPTATSKPSRASSARSPRRPRPKRKFSPATTTSAPIASEDARRTPPARARASSGVNSTTSDLVDAGVLEQLEPPLERARAARPGCRARAADAGRT